MKFNRNALSFHAAAAALFFFIHFSHAATPATDGQADGVVIFDGGRPNPRRAPDAESVSAKTVRGTPATRGGNYSLTPYARTELTHQGMSMPMPPSPTKPPTIDITLSQNGVPIPIEELQKPLQGEFEATVHIQGAKGQHIQIYNNMVGLLAEMADSDDWTGHINARGISRPAQKGEIDIKSLYDGEQLFNVHVHPMSLYWKEFDADGFNHNQVTYATVNGRPAPHGDWKLPSMELPAIGFDDGQTSYPSTRELMHYSPEHGWILNRLSGRIRDDCPGAAQNLAHIGSGIILGWSYPGFDTNTRRLPPEYVAEHASKETVGQLPIPADFYDLSTFVVMRPFLSEQPRFQKVVYFISDCVGRANLIDGQMRLPPLPKDAVPLTDLPSARLLRFNEFDELVLPNNRRDFKFRVAVNLPKTGKYAPANRKILLLRVFAGNILLGNLDLIAYAKAHPGLTKFIAEFPAGDNRKGPPQGYSFTGNRVTDVYYANVEDRETGLFGKAPTATAFWVEFLVDDPVTNMAYSLPNLEHMHMNSVRSEGYLDDTDSAKWTATDLDGTPVDVAQPAQLTMRLAKNAGVSGTFQAGNRLQLGAMDGRQIQMALAKIETTAVLQTLNIRGDPAGQDPFPTYILCGAEPQSCYYAHDLASVVNLDAPSQMAAPQSIGNLNPYDPSIP